MGSAEAKIVADAANIERATGNMEQPSKIRQVRREIARIKTLLNERSRA